MAEIYTLSGPDAGVTVPSTHDLDCAEQVKPMLIIGGVTKVASVGVGLFSTYKLLKGRGAAGITGLLGTAVLWFAGSALISASARGFEACRRTP